MNFNEVEEIIEEGKFKKAVAGALLGATLASGAMAQEAKVRTRRPSNRVETDYSLPDDDGKPTELRDTYLEFPDIDDFPFKNIKSISPKEKESKPGPGLGENKSESGKKEAYEVGYKLGLQNMDSDVKSEYLKVQKDFIDGKITEAQAVRNIMDIEKNDEVIFNFNRATKEVNAWKVLFCK